MRKLIAVSDSISALLSQLNAVFPPPTVPRLPLANACLELCYLAVQSPQDLQNYNGAHHPLPRWNPLEDVFANLMRIFPNCSERAVLCLFSLSPVQNHIVCVREWNGLTVLVDTHLTQVPMLWPGNLVDPVLAALNLLYPREIRRVLYTVPCTGSHSGPPGVE